MERLREMWRQLAALFGRDRSERELDEEMRYHLEMQAEENREAGMDPEDASYAAARRFGNPALLKERSRDAWGWGFLDTLAQDVRYAFRAMRRSPGLTFAAVLSLALGIGADTALFSAMDAFWFRPLAVADPGGLARVYATTDRDARDSMSFADYLDIAKASKTLSGLAASERRGPILTVGGVAESTLAEAVSDNYFTVLGVNAARGRIFHAQPRMEREVVISHGLWQRKFGGDPALVGRQVEVSGQPYTVVGIAPKGFRGIELWADVGFWLPLSVWQPKEQHYRGKTSQTIVGRLAPGTTLAQARAELSGIAGNLAAAYPKTNKGRGATVISALEYQIESGGTAAVILASIIAMLLLIACANVANLLLARGEARRRELAVRMSLGCGRRRLVRQLLTESLVLAGLGAAAALLLATWLIRVLPSLLPAEDVQLRLDNRVLGFALVSAAITGVIFGLLPALRVSRPDLAPLLSRLTPRARRHAIPLRDALVVAQAALSLVLLACAGLLVRSFLHCLDLDLGFARKNILVVQMYPDMPETQARGFYDQLLERVRGLGGVRQAGLVRRTPLWKSEGGMTMRVRVPGHPSGADDEPFAFKFTTAGDGYFRTMGIPLLRGREFDRRDNAAGLPVAMINQTMARRFWPSEDPIGKIVVTGTGTARQIVGVVKDTKINAVLEAPEPYLFLPFGQDYSYSMSLVVEATGDPLGLAGPIRSEIRALAKIPAPEIATLESLVRDSTFVQRSIAFATAALSVLGLLLTAAGLYGVLSFLVTRRTQEIGIRIALGAGKGQTVALVLRHALAMAGIGAAIGLAGALALSRVLSSLLFGVSPRDPLTLGAVCALLASVAALASLLPALRASSVDPIEALRYE